MNGNETYKRVNEIILSNMSLEQLSEVEKWGINQKSDDYDQLLYIIIFFLNDFLAHKKKYL